MTSIDPSQDIATHASPDRTLDHLALLRVRGVDARSFLDSQLTRNVPAVGAASLAGYCSPKGRLLASLVVWADDDGIGLLISRDIADAIAKRLRMYVLRAKVTIDRVGDDVPITGRLAAKETTLQKPWTVDADGAAARIRVPDAEGHARHLMIGAVGHPQGSSEDSTWRWLDIRAGIATVTAATQDRFVPQMLNLEALGGVDFRKGCFPGQEVVARSQYLGKLKRRTTLATMDGDVPMPGTDVFLNGSSDPTGVVVNAEHGPDGRVALLAELPIALFASEGLRVGSGTGPALAIEALPYALPDNEVFVRPKL